MDDPIETAENHFDQGYNCAQSVFSSFAPQFGLPAALAQRIATPFGGGMGRTGEVCGAVSGAVMLIGLKTGTSTAGDTVSKNASYEMVKEFFKRFEERNGSILCRDILGADISTPEGLARAREMGLTKRCPKFVKDAAEILHSLIQDQ